MQCNCKYYKFVDGQLVCSVCGKPAHTYPVVEAKIILPEENKSVVAVKTKPAARRKGR